MSADAGGQYRQGHDIPVIQSLMSHVLPPDSDRGLGDRAFPGHDRLACSGELTPTVQVVPCAAGP